MLSERLMVERRWAMEMVVLLPLRRAPRAWLTRVSDSASRADVAGSSVSTLLGGRIREPSGWDYLHLRSRYLGS